MWLIFRRSDEFSSYCFKRVCHVGHFLAINYEFMHLKQGKNNNVLFDAHANIQLTYFQIQILYHYIYISKDEKKNETEFKT